MSEVVFILGAGASQDSGCPLMFDFLDTAFRLSSTGSLDDISTEIAQVARVRSELQRAFAKASIDIDNIESVFAAIEMGKTIGRLGELKADELEAARNAIIRVIYRTIEESQRFQLRRSRDSDGFRLKAPDSYRLLADLIWQLRAGPPRRSVSVISFNYDVAIDVALLQKELSPLYWLREEKEGPPGSIDLLKLHGSIAWAVEKQSNEVQPMDLAEVNWSVLERPKRVSFAAFTEHVISRFGHEFIADAPFIVPPTDAKFIYRDRILPVWQRAAAHLHDARIVVIVGYSIPPTDEFFKQFYALSTISDEVLEHVVVIDVNEKVIEKYKRVFGDGALRRLEYFGEGFNAGVQRLRTLLRVP